MRLVGIGTVKNEADIIESFVRHNLGRLDALVLIDDGSVDGTREILNSLEGEGLNLITLEWDGTIGHDQSRKMSELLAVLASRIDADWIFALDGDEAIDCNDRDTIEEALGNVTAGQIAVIPWRTYIPTPADDWTQFNPFLRIVNRKAEEMPQFYKIIVPISVSKSLPTVITSGNHSAHKAWSLKLLPTIALDKVVLAHFPVRSPKQVVKKAICGYLSMLAEGRKRPNRAFHWRDMYAKFMQNGTPTINGIQRLAQGYSGQIDDGCSRRFPVRIADKNPLRFTKEADSPDFVTIARTAERLIDFGRDSDELNESKKNNHLRTSWRYRGGSGRGMESDHETVARTYLEHRFRGGIRFVDDRNFHLLSSLYDDIRDRTANPIHSIISLSARSYRELLSSTSWRDKGWFVDYNATLALRLLACSNEIRRYAVVLVSCTPGPVGHALSCSIPPPSQPYWREALRLAILRGHFIAVKLYWHLFRSAVTGKQQAEIINRMGRDRGVGDIPLVTKGEEPV